MEESVAFLKELKSASDSGNVDYVDGVELDKLLQWRSPNTGDSALAIAAAFSNTSSVCEKIFERCPSLLDKTNLKGATILHSAATNDKSEVMKFLLSLSGRTEATAKGKGKAKASAGTSGNTTDDTIKELLLKKMHGDKTALHTAVETERNFEVIELLINKADKNLLEMTDFRGDTALHIAVKNNSLPSVKLLVKAYPDYEYLSNKVNLTPLYIAFKEGLTGDETRVAIRKLLIEKHPQQQCHLPIGIILENKRTLLHHAADKGDLSTIEDIIKFWPEICMEKLDINGQNFLHIAAKFKRTDVVSYILKLPTITPEILNKKDVQGNTPLHIAAMNDQVGSTAICLLYDSRVDKEILNSVEKVVDGVKKVVVGVKATDMIFFDYDKSIAEVRGGVTEKEIKDQSAYDLVVCTLIAAATFAAGITVPGGHFSDGDYKGSAVLARELSFKVFLFANASAFYLSLFGVLSHFCLKLLHKRVDIVSQLNMAKYSSFGAILAWAITFMASLHVGLAKELFYPIFIPSICFIPFAIWSGYMIYSNARQTTPVPTAPTPVPTAPTPVPTAPTTPTPVPTATSNA